MFLPIKPVVDRSPRKDGTAVVYIQYCYSSDKRTLLATGLSPTPVLEQTAFTCISGIAARIRPGGTAEHTAAENDTDC